MILTAIAQAKDHGRKLKYFVHEDMQISNLRLASAKTHDGLHVNGQSVHADYVLHSGDRVEIEILEVSERQVIPENGTFTIVYEDADLMIIDKPAPLACQCTPRQPTGTLENRLAWYFLKRTRPLTSSASPGPSVVPAASVLPDSPVSSVPFVFRPLNRLDRGTSGLMAVAKNAHAYHLLQQQLHSPDLIREYQAVTEGIWDGKGTIDAPIAKDKSATVRRIIDPIDGKRSVTHYQVLCSGKDRTLVQLVLETGRTHQIRVHLSSLGHPVAGDFLYGWELPELPDRFALHSSHLILRHPITEALMEFYSPLPQELKNLFQF